jgi:glycosyltransferase involved in cell wall biosynthesis
MKVSIITSTYNSAKTIRRTMESLRSQEYSNIEHIVIDGNSTDGTQEVIKSYSHVKTFISEPDRGVYDALNKGLELASGDIIGILHSDDIFHSKLSVARVVSALVEHPDWDGVYGDIRFVDQKGNSTRKYSCKNWKFSDFSRGIMPAHPSFFARKAIYEKERFDLQYQIAADFDLLLRLFQKQDAKYGYIPYISTDMSSGGLSTKSWKSNLIINKEIRQICRRHGVKTSYLKIYAKYFKRLTELRRL